MRRKENQKKKYEREEVGEIRRRRERLRGEEEVGEPTIRRKSDRSKRRERRMENIKMKYGRDEESKIRRMIE
jgi:hypothetical protein